MQPQFELSPEPLLKVRPGAFSQIWHPPEDHKWGGGGGGAEQKYLSSYPRLEWPAEGSIFKPACFPKLPILTDKSLNITLLPRKSEKRSKRETS